MHFSGYWGPHLSGSPHQLRGPCKFVSPTWKYLLLPLGGDINSSLSCQGNFSFIFQSYLLSINEIRLFKGKLGFVGPFCLGLGKHWMRNVLEPCSLSICTKALTFLTLWCYCPVTPILFYHEVTEVISLTYWRCLTGVTYIKFNKTSEAALAMEEMNGRCIGNHPRPLKVLIAHRYLSGDGTVSTS